MHVSERVRRAGLRTGRGWMRHRKPRVSWAFVALRQHGRMVLLRVQPGLPKCYYVLFCGRQYRDRYCRRPERPGTDVGAADRHNVPRWVRTTRERVLYVTGVLYVFRRRRVSDQQSHVPPIDYLREQRRFVRMQMLEKRRWRCHSGMQV